MFVSKLTVDYCDPTPAAKHASVSEYRDESGVVAEYTCLIGHIFIEGGSSRSLICKNGYWTNKLSGCIGELDLTLFKVYCNTHLSIAQLVSILMSCV